MFKRVFWVAAGVVLGVLAVSKATAYVRANTPDKARQFLLGPHQANVGLCTLQGPVHQFRQAPKALDEVLNRLYHAKLS